MEIVSVSRIAAPIGKADTFVVGSPPVEDGKFQEGPDVTVIKYFATSTVYDKIHRHGVYIVEFENSSMKRVIPESKVIDITVETEKKDNIPELP